MDPKIEAECQEVLNKMLDFFWFKIRTRMLLLGEPYEVARDAILDEMRAEPPPHS